MSGLSFAHKIFLFLGSLIQICVANDVLGCGGYVRSDVEINFSQVGIKLFTKQGNLKYETECAPNNGYYFIPLYDKGSYIIKVAPPPGWSFSPEEVSLKVDGETDACTLGKDINFHFKGFAVVGKVVSAGSDVGPAGVTVSLLRGDDVIQTTKTTVGGSYVFTPLSAGKYTVLASHDRWTLLKDKVEVSVADENGDAGSSLVVAGYRLTGSVTTDGQPTPGVSFILHALTEETLPVLGCTLGAPAGYKNNGDLFVVCHVNSDASGVFNFATVPTGTYSLTPFFQSEDTKYEVIPDVQKVVIANADVALEKPFRVEGFSISGAVVNRVGGTALIDATVVLDGTLKTTTDNKGAFVFHNVKSGLHKIKVTADKFEFEESSVRISPQSTVLPPLAPARYEVCFSVTLEKTASYSGPWSIAVASSKSAVTVDLASADQGCVFLIPAKYQAHVKLSPEADQAGMRFGPREHSFEVVSEPISQLAFSQFLGEISGKVSCLEKCPEIKLSLKSAQGGAPRTITAQDGNFTFTEVVPGSYQLSVQKEEWCWEAKSLPVAVNTQNVEVSLEHIGYQLTMASSHETTLSYTTNTGGAGTLKAQKGTTMVCVNKPAVYTLTPIGCHKFSNTPVQWDTSAPSLVSLAATHHQLTGSIRTTESAPFTVSVKSGANDVTTLGPLNPSPEDSLLYVFENWVKEGETVSLTPGSPSNLYQYKPASHSLTMPSQCVLSSVEFKAERALFIHGRVNPKIAGVTITVDGGGNTHTFTTDDEGQYTAGPLDNAVKFTVNAEKKGYVLNPLPEKGHFEAYKLAEVHVSIKDENDVPLSGVLVSMSGGKSYRQNSLTDKDGTISFMSLNPGDYFLRPMMKEYMFEPASKMVQVLEGATLEVSISGVRVAYSVYGQTVSLSGEAETEVVVEAVGKAATGAEECSQYQEEAVSDNHGHFRIRGLLPKCKYILRLKSGPGINKNVHRTLPATQVIQTDNADVENLKLLLIRHFNQLDVTAKVEVDERYLSSLTAKLYREDLPDSPVHTVKLGTHPFFLLPPLTANGHSYFLRLESNLPKSQYQYNTPEISFIANTSFLHLRLSFDAKVNSVEAEMNQGTVMGLAFAILLIIVASNFQKFGPMVEKLSEIVSSITAARPASPTMSSQPETTEHAYIEPIKKKVKSRKI